MHDLRSKYYFQNKISARTGFYLGNFTFREHTLRKHDSDDHTFTMRLQRAAVQYIGHVDKRSVPQTTTMAFMTMAMPRMFNFSISKSTIYSCNLGTRRL